MSLRCQRQEVPVAEWNLEVVGTAKYFVVKIHMLCSVWNPHTPTVSYPAYDSLL